jgi:hypothetical protein
MDPRGLAFVTAYGKPYPNRSIPSLAAFFSTSVSWQPFVESALVRIQEPGYRENLA